MLFTLDISGEYFALHTSAELFISLFISSAVLNRDNSKSDIAKCDQLADEGKAQNDHDHNQALAQSEKALKGAFTVRKGRKFRIGLHTLRNKHRRSKTNMNAQPAYVSYSPVCGAWLGEITSEQVQIWGECIWNCERDWGPCECEDYHCYVDEKIIVTAPGATNNKWMEGLTPKLIAKLWEDRGNFNVPVKVFGTGEVLKAITQTGQPALVFRVHVFRREDVDHYRPQQGLLRMFQSIFNGTRGNRKWTHTD
ncbi:hypothetical protein CFELI_04390 [Corynebacterium felinum]|nr:hypothetical protein CFELI_04390 [Corynebacterium felinum]